MLLCRLGAEGRCQCQRCAARKGDFSSADFRGSVTTSVDSTATRREGIAQAASGVDLPKTIRCASMEAVVDWGDVSEIHSTGPNSAHYEDARRQYAGLILCFDTFWLLPRFCVYQMLMRDSMHTIDLGVIVTLIRAILPLPALLF